MHSRFTSSHSSDSDAGASVPTAAGTFAALKIPVYRLYYAALLCQMAAMNMQMIARSWYMYELTNSATMLGVVGLGAALPMLTVSLFGGVLADRMKKKTILLAGQAATGIVALVIGVSITLGTISWIHLLVGGFLQGLVMSLMMPARQSLVYELVGEESLMNAIALNSAAMNLLRLLAPAFTGFFIALWNIEGVYYIMAGLYAVGVTFAVRLPNLELASQEEKKGTISDLKAGLVYIRDNREVMAVLILTLVATILSMNYMFLLPIFTKDIFFVDVTVFGSLTTLPIVGKLLLTLSESSARLGLLVSISGMGALAGSLVVASMTNQRRGLVYMLSLLLTSVSLVAFSITNSFVIALISFIPMGFGQAGRMALSNTLLQSYSEDEYRGRVMSVYMMEWGITMVGVFFVSVLADLIGAQWAVGSAAAVLVLILTYCLLFIPLLRKMD
jgi:MFS family permease